MKGCQDLDRPRRQASVFVPDLDRVPRSGVSLALRVSDDGHALLLLRSGPVTMNLFSLPDPQPLLVSFDVFDTLLLRRVERPTALFERMGERARAAGLVDPALTPPLFRLARQEAERRARAKVRGGR